MDAKDKKQTELDYTQLKSKMYKKFLIFILVAFVVITVLYILIWHGRGADWIVSILQQVFRLDYQNALNVYQQLFRNYADLIWLGAIAVIFLFFFRFFINWVTQYFTIINNGIDALLSEEEAEIHLLSEMSATEKKLNTVKQTLKNRTMEARLAEQRKNDLVMYLAHDIRTPLTSVIGYLNLLDEAPDMPARQKEKYLHVSLNKAYQLEKMINEFFEITRYNLQQINLTKETIDLYYMLVQLSDELSPLLAANGNTARLIAEETLTVYGDPDKLARVFNNVLKNAAAYSYPNTEIIIAAKVKSDVVEISFQNKGNTIPKEKLSAIFEKFYRLDEARTSNTGNAGLGLAIAKEIVTLHGGTISAVSENNIVKFLISLPLHP
ncbi:HAMP domain-containing histidine kinase [Bariatricus massiliensis]|uniref:histidine kinase n=1 Tax=Bariatricus massiliensis TaxID=1745713 RepID=A0ABS8DD11_9FIRM|nr:HAMP domain-containing sensor histidine kinase [Bariatricus massiliensis]MCB7303499.1 HAMP domain-containing histidine kinase [Bariatricus massiliensis]MCB7373631.1 HAMP domain-containing histidine kinase [Bariatricus massiliensis]MCB7386301.1 HAMP domain-containing histidine kinase [Bariatricus massiliensis]MCB7410463.1 HAMP domain-containing histidine kinase [Bariatricus massiliensis]